MAKTMLIDAVHQEETRVVVVSESNQVEEFDFESKAKTQLRGNIYLAKVTRIEPSLQAAFVDYGGNRHGFLAFNEIHPDYYQIPIADKELLLEAEAAANEALAEEEKAIDTEISGDSGDINDADEVVGDDDPVSAEEDAAESVSAQSHEDTSEESEHTQSSDNEIALKVEDTENLSIPVTASPEGISDADDVGAVEPEQTADSEDGEDGEAPAHEASLTDAISENEEPIESIEADPSIDTEATDDPDDEDPMLELRRLRRQKLRSYKIQEVIKRRQVLLVQVVKEERGNKGAALTTYLSLAGRYCVLMPNTGRGGGISRKITNGTDRKRLRKIVDAMEVPEGMGLIIRTAGSKRTKTEIKRDYEYLLRIWENVRTLTLESIAPTLVYEEGSLVKRAIRDLYNKDIDEVLVEGEDSYKEAKGFMRLLMPSHAKNVKQHKEQKSIFQKFEVENQLDATLSPEVPLPSGGYLVINPTEALVSIDVNSGKSTKERNVENTAVRTNIEAAAEVARQCRLRDLAGLIVIDFIDMEEGRNNRTVERRLREALKQDRARTQVGRLSTFGLLEMSRQRMRSGVLEGSSQTCPTCHGSGLVRSESSTALRILRAIEEIGHLDNSEEEINVRACEKVALYLLNTKRAELREAEDRCGVHATVTIDDSFSQSVFSVTRGTQQVTSDSFQETKAAPQPSARTASPDQSREEDDAEGGNGRGRKRRRRRGGKKSGRTSEDDSNQLEKEASTDEGADESRENGSGNGKRRRGRRGGRKRRGEQAPQQDAAAPIESSGEEPTGANLEESQPDLAQTFDASPNVSETSTDEIETASEPSTPIEFVDNANEDASQRATDEAYVPASDESFPSNGHGADASENVSDEEHVDREAPTEEIETVDRQSPDEGYSQPPTSDVVAQKSEPSRKGWWQKRFF